MWAHGAPQRATRWQKPAKVGYSKSSDQSTDCPPKAVAVMAANTIVETHRHVEAFIFMYKSVRLFLSIKVFLRDGLSHPDILTR